MSFGRVALRSAQNLLQTVGPLVIEESSKTSTKIRNSGIFRFENRSRFYSTSGSTATSADDDIIITVENGVRCITFNRPQKKNAVDYHMAIHMTQALMESNADEKTNIIVIRGSGDHFTSGMDLSGIKAKKPNAVTEASRKSQLVLDKPKKKSDIFIFAASLINCEKPLIALVNGPAVGFGVTMLGLCDTVYCSDAATFQTRFTEFGLPPELCSTYTFPRIMGYNKANNMLLFNNKINAEEAYKAGLVSRIFPNSRFHEETWKIIQDIAQLPVKSLIYSKKLVRGRERETLQKVHASEQEKFDPEVAREVKRKWLERQALRKA